MAFCQENRVTNLLEFLEYVTDAVVSGMPVDVIYLDFQKAFDNPIQSNVMWRAQEVLSARILNNITLSTHW